MVAVIAFDGDDTLWHNETLFSVTQEKFRALLRPHVAEADIDASLYATETRNLGLFGYGIKGFTLSMIETAIELSGGRVTGSEIRTLIDYGKAMLDHPVELLDGVEEIVGSLCQVYRVMLITKGDLFDQESKIARSGLADLFRNIEIVSEKDPATYRRILRSHEIAPDSFLMVGNSVKSDILPVLEIGGRAVHIPYHVTWAHEQPDPLADPLAAAANTYRTLDSILELPGLLRDLADSA
jgi:putative hydrolase of the HAD superfamily